MSYGPTEPVASVDPYASAGTGDRGLFGWRVRSEIPLHELPAWRGDDRDPDILVTLGHVGALERATTFGPAIRFSERALRLEIPNVARYLVEGGSRVVVDAILPPASADVRVFLLGTVLSVLCFRRGMIPLHAAALDVGGRALLLAGQSGIGKSSLAAVLLARGCRLLSDDVCALDVSRPDRPLIWPSFPRVKLWEDAAQRLRIPTTGLDQVRMELRKFMLPVDAFQGEPLPPAHLVLLQRALRPSEAGEQQLVGMDAMSRPDVVHRRSLGIAMGYQPMMFSALNALLRFTPMTLFKRINDASQLPSLADRVLELAQRPAS